MKKKSKTSSKLTYFFYIVSQPFSYILQLWFKQNWRYYILDATSQVDALRYKRKMTKEQLIMHCSAYINPSATIQHFSIAAPCIINCTLSLSLFFSLFFSLSLSLYSLLSFSVLDAGLFTDFD